MNLSGLVTLRAKIAQVSKFRSIFEHMKIEERRNIKSKLGISYRYEVVQGYIVALVKYRFAEAIDKSNILVLSQQLTVNNSTKLIITRRITAE